VRTLKDIHAAMAKLETEAKAIRSQAEENTPEKGVDGKGLLSLTAEGRAAAGRDLRRVRHAQG
jgi:hypothetical protein